MRFVQMPPTRQQPKARTLKNFLFSYFLLFLYLQKKKVCTTVTGQSPDLFEIYLPLEERPELLLLPPDPDDIPELLELEREEVPTDEPLERDELLEELLNEEPLERELRVEELFTEPELLLFERDERTL